MSADDVLDLDIAIIGAGLGGLGTALALAKKGFRNITVFENTADLGFVGAGIQLAPNLVRILSRLGCWEAVEAEATEVLEASIRDGATDEELTHVHMPDLRIKYGYPHCTAHRASLVAGLYKACQEMPGIRFHFGRTLTEITSFEPRVRFVTSTPDGLEQQHLTADVLLAADGVKSRARDALLQRAGFASEEKDTGQAAYRILLPRDKMEHDPEMMALLDDSQVTRWIAEKRHWIAYPIQSRSIYNMSSIQPDTNFATAPSMTYTTKGSKTAMLDVFSDFCPLVQRMLNLVPDRQVCEWKLRAQKKPLPTWVHGGVALVGDACHPTLPHLNQGAAQAIEDAAVLAEVLARCPDAELTSVNKSLQVYELLRKERASTLVEWAAESGRVLHLGEGKAKEERDRRFAEAMTSGKVPDSWASFDVQEYIYSHDCVKNAQEKFGDLYKKLG